MAQLTIAEDESQLADRVAERMTVLIERAISARGEAIVSLTGGSTPRVLYQRLADRKHPWRDRIEWAHVQLFWGDERHVPPDHPDSNYGMAKAAMLDHVPIPSANVHRMRGELADPHDAAREYERLLPPQFDVMLLGLGEDAHIASIFPGSVLSGSDQGSKTAAVWAAHLNTWRITLTPPALLGSRVIVMLVAGANKADAVRAALDAPLDVTRWPAQILRQADERVEWWIDRAAASAR